ncbi:autotransporter outer membrane beta-barrel domain-containing protein [Cetobacterium sp. 2A]|uniref:autotransporter family protein n=1 Tax=Cetobacterium sp. 2A TaxID=2754723 RepID=UPI00163BAD7D|nr:autotransporter outer membrane beta-barrel domain-containing protein [Cetobacterium sp. 2A]
MKNEKIIKGCLKKYITITQSILVLFLMTANIGYAIVPLQNEGLISNEKIIDSTSKPILGQATGSGISELEISEKPNLNKIIDSITNGGIIKGEVITKQENDNYFYANGNGIITYVYSKMAQNLTASIKEVNNKGLIKGNASIMGENTKEYKNSLSGYGTGSTTGNGNGIGAISVNDSYDKKVNGDNIKNLLSTIGNINNKGLIVGKSQVTGIDSGKGFGHSLGNGNGIVSLSSMYSSNRTLHVNSNIGNINNEGVIKGSAVAEGNAIISIGHASASAVLDDSGNGISITSSYNGGKTQNLGKDSTGLNSVGNIFNKGIIKGAAEVKGAGAYTFSHRSGNGISLGVDVYGNNLRVSSTINNINNKGIIVGKLKAEGDKPFIYGGGNGINLGTDPNTDSSKYNILKIENSGIVKGIKESEKGNYYSSGNGISFGDSNTYGKIQEIVNTGIIGGNKNAINIRLVEILQNEGILYGEKTTSYSPTIFNKKGIEILLSSNGSGEINNIINGNEGTSLDGKIIINGQRYDENGHATDTANIAKDSYIISNGNVYSNNIINGAGISKGALIVQGGTHVSDSIVNGFNTAVYLDDLSQLTATNTIFNGGGLKNDVAVIKGSDNDNVASILGNSIINGNVDLGNGDDTLTIANTVQINGNLDGGNDLDILNLGEKTTSKVASNLNIFHEINNFENISTNGDITLFEVAKVTGADEINLESGNLILRVDPTITLDGKVTGHALYGNNGTLSSTGGNLVIGLNGIGANTTVSMGGTTITSGTNDSWWKDTDHIKTNSLVLDGKLSDDGKDVNITIKEFIPLEPSKPIPPIDPPIDPPVDPPTVIDSLLYEKLNKVYQSTVTAGEIGALANTTLLEDKTYEESLGGLLTILDQIYANNPYAYTLKSSRDSLKLFEDNMSYLTIKPKENEWIIQGKGIYTGVKNDNASSGKNYYGFDTGHRNYKTTTSTSGGLATFEYGLSDKTSIGGVIGGNNQDINFKGSSKIKGNSLYLGTFAKTDINNFKLMAGLGYQYTAADADRSVSNMYDSFKTSDKYDINSLNAFAEVKYSIEGNDNWTLEPKARLSYYYIEQDSVNEGYTPGQLSIAVDKANSNTADLELGIDLIKNVYLQQGKLKNIFSFGIINTIGDKSKELNGYVLGNSKDGNKFDIQGIELPRTSGKVAYNLELEQTSGMIYTAGVSMEFAKDYNRNASATIGLGYKF